MPDPDAASNQTAIIAVSRPGAVLARRLAASMSDAALYLERRTGEDSSDGIDGSQYYDLPLRPVIQDLFTRYGALVVFLPVGAAVRLLAPVLGSKRQDPAVVCVDDAGRYAVSVLSGHVGGADALAHRVADAIGAQAIVTSASDALAVTAIDLVGRDAGWRVEASPTDLTRAAAAVVNGDPVALWLDPETGAAWPDGTPLSENIFPVASLSDLRDPGYTAVLIVSDRLLDIETGRPLITYRPPTLVAGVGCRRGVAEDHLRGLLQDTLRTNRLAIRSLKQLATADIKADEAGIIALAETLDVTVAIYDAVQLNSVPANQPEPAGTAAGLHRPTPSAAHDLLGVFGVAEPAAMLASGADGVIVPRTKSDRATIAVARIPSAKGNAPELAAMDEPETVALGEALLAAAQREIGKGNLHEGAGLVWEATMEALAAAAERCGRPCRNRDEALAFVNYLDDTAADPADEIYTHRNLAAFSVADSYREEYRGEASSLGDPELRWDSDDFATRLQSVRRFVRSLNERTAGSRAP